MSSTKNKIALADDEIFLPSLDRACLQHSDEVIKSLASDAEYGISTREAEHRLTKLGKNIRSKTNRTSWQHLLLRQFKSTVVILLFFAAAISICSAQYLQAAAIFVALIINGIVGFFTEYRSQISLEELDKLTGVKARVRRAGVDEEIPVENLVPGDIILLEQGDRVPADARIISSKTLLADESLLTGESIPNLKNSEPEVLNSDQNLLYQGSIITSGKGKAIVIATGCDTKLGKVGSTLIAIEYKPTPLQTELEQLGKHLSVGIILICGAIASIGFLRGERDLRMLQTSLALAVAAIPEGLPVIATLALTEGTRRMTRFGALVRKIAAVETLGCTDVVCTDKTGTLTTNQQLVTDIVVSAKHYTLSGTGYHPSGLISDESGETVNISHSQTLLTTLTAAVLCNDARLESHEDSDWHIHGDPTEGALLAAASKANLDKENLENLKPRTSEFPFDLQRRRMTTLHSVEDQTIAYCKGAPEVILQLCSAAETDSGVIDLDDTKQFWFKKQNELLAQAGLRVLALAYKKVDTSGPSDCQSVESKMTLLGLIGMKDQAKEGVQEALHQCLAAGINVIMMTGDQSHTACAVAKELGINRENVMSRVQPEQKFQIVKSLQEKDKVVAMVGDGINDALALKQANIGIAMGRKGTSLAREAADIVLTDDNFSILVHAIEIGRIIYANIRYSIAYLLTASFASVLTIIGAEALALPMPLSPLQLLWLNLIMHIFPALGLALQDSYPNIMADKPRGKNQSLVDRKMWLQITLRGAIVATMTLFAVDHFRHAPEAIIQTVALATISLSLILQSWAWLASKKGVDVYSYLFNMPMHLCSLCSVALLFLATNSITIQQILLTTQLDANAWNAVVFYTLGSFLFSSAFSE